MVAYIAAATALFINDDCVRPSDWWHLASKGHAIPLSEPPMIPDRKPEFGGEFCFPWATQQTTLSCLQSNGSPQIRSSLELGSNETVDSPMIWYFLVMITTSRIRLANQFVTNKATPELLANYMRMPIPQGSQHFMKKIFPEFSLIFPWEISKITRNTFSSRCVIFTEAIITSQSMDTTWTHGTRRTYTNWRKAFPSGSHSHIPWVFPDFWCFPQIPWVFPDWKIGNSFSRFSLISRVAGNPAIWRKLYSA